MLTVLPGLVASGGALLFGVNTWCLDGRGALWRDSLPVSPRIAFLSRVSCCSRCCCARPLLTLVLAALRAGRPTTSELVALVCSTLVVSAQVVSAGMRWSIARPFAVDLRSARATPAPPVVMAGYSARLALATTVTGLIFSGLAQVGDAALALLVSVLLLLWSAWRLRAAAQRWEDPVVRSRVVADGRRLTDRSGAVAGAWFEGGSRVNASVMPYRPVVVDIWFRRAAARVRIRGPVRRFQPIRADRVDNGGKIPHEEGISLDCSWRSSPRSATLGLSVPAQAYPDNPPTTPAALHRRSRARLPRQTPAVSTSADLPNTGGPNVTLLGGGVALVARGWCRRASWPVAGRPADDPGHATPTPRRTRPPCPA